MNTSYHSPIDIDGISHRKQEGGFIFSNNPEHWTPCSVAEDTMLTLGTFVLMMAAPVAFFVWMVS